MTPRTRMIRTAFRLEGFTVAWLAVEAAVAIASGISARSISLVAFGLDSLIELASASVLIWRLTVELRRGQSFAAAAEHTARRIGGVLLLALSAYVVVAAGWRLWTRRGKSFSWPGLLVSLGAIPIMWVVARRKLAIAEALGSEARRIDAVESITCCWLSFVVVVGLVAQRLLGAWWIDAVTSLTIVSLLFREGREAWRGDTENQ